MTRFFILIGALAGGLLAGCAHERAQMVPGYAWAFMQNDQEGAKLAYGRPASDEVLLMITCRRGEAQVGLSMLAAKTQPHLILASARQEARLNATAQTDPMTGGLLIQAKAPSDAPTLKNFRRTGELKVVNAGRRFEVSSSRTDRQEVSRFFRACAA